MKVSKGKRFHSPGSSSRDLVKGPIAVTFFWGLSDVTSIWGIISGHVLKKLALYFFITCPMAQLLHPKKISQKTSPIQPVRPMTGGSLSHSTWRPKPEQGTINFHRFAACLISHQKMEKIGWPPANLYNIRSGCFLAVQRPFFLFVSLANWWSEINQSYTNQIYGSSTGFLEMLGTRFSVMKSILQKNPWRKSSFWFLLTFGEKNADI